MKRRGIGSGPGVLVILGVLAVGCGSDPIPTLGFDLPINRDAPFLATDATEPDPGNGRDVLEPVDPGRDPGVDPGTPDPGIDPGTDDPGIDPGTPDQGTDPGTDDPGSDPGTPDPGLDSGPVECHQGESRTVACGLNGRGKQSQVCVEGFWRDFDACIDPDVCIDGEEASEPCGLNGRGSQVNPCVEGAWAAGDCEDPDECVDDDSRTVACGTKALGRGDQTCTAGVWVAQGDCRTPGRWQCVEEKCTPLFGAPLCGNGECEPKSGESPQTCPADCGHYAGTSGEGATCSDAFDCAFYDWPIKGYGYWVCVGLWSRTCKSRADARRCGTNGYEHCQISQLELESDQSCPLDCPGKSLACRGAYDCIYHLWPAEAW